MKITLELESDDEKAQAARFLGSNETPQVIQISDIRVAFRVLLALRQVTARLAAALKRVHA